MKWRSSPWLSPTSIAHAGERGEPRWEGKSSAADRGRKTVAEGYPPILTPERVQAAVPGEGVTARNTGSPENPPQVSHT